MKYYFEEFDKLVAWRFSQLVKCGYDPLTSKKMAKRCIGLDQVDLEDARQLVAAGCTPDVAASILL